MPWRRSTTWQKPVPHSISNRLEGIKAEKYGPKLITLADSFYAYQRRKRTSSIPSGRVPSSLTKFSPEERIACMMLQIIDSSRTHGTHPGSEDSTPSTGLCVSPLPLSIFCICIICLVSLSFFYFSRPSRVTLCLACTLQMRYPHSSYLGASFTEA